MNNIISFPYPEKGKEVHRFDVSNNFANSHEKITWRCNLNHIWVEKIINRTENDVNYPKSEHK